MPSLRRLGWLVLLPVLLGAAGCAARHEPASSCTADAVTARPPQPVDGGTPPAAPARVVLTPGSRSDLVTVRVVAETGAAYDAAELRVFVDGCRVPWTDEGDELPTRTIRDLAPGDRVQVLARLDGEGGNSAETASPVLVVR